MKNYPAFLLCLICAGLFSCDNEGTEIAPAAIDYSLSDKVSPVMAHFSVHESYTHTQWVINDSMSYYRSGEVSLEHFFVDPGPVDVKVYATGDDEVTHIGILGLEIPKRASTMMVCGLSLASPSQLFASEDSVKLSVNYHRSSGIEERILYLSEPLPAAGDAIVFEEPLVFDIDGFYAEDAVPGHWVSVWLQNMATYEPKYYFKSDFYVKDRYFNERLSARDGGLKLQNRIEGDLVQIELLVEWR